MTIVAEQGRITTHVLDVTQGRPAANVVTELWWLGIAGAERHLLVLSRTNAAGRTDAPLLASPAISVGYYALEFAIGPYFAAQRLLTATPPFLDRIVIRFGVADPSGHYHIPLLVSPWAYSTYRGS